ncbi:MAG: hypothetical protein ACOC2F_03815 [Bacteroidota bacterium]
MLKIYKLKSPDLLGDTIIFSTNVPNVDMKVIPYKSFTKWEIVTAYNLDYDSISVTINTRGPFYGGGERFLASNLNGRTISNQPQNPPFLHRNIGKMSKDEYETSYLSRNAHDRNLAF